MNKIKLAIIIVNYNGADDTIQCVKSLKQINIYNKIKIIIVDNNSNQLDKEKLLSLNLETEIIFSKSNQGFAIANNIGISKAIEEGIDNILLLNNDTIVTENSLNYMINTLESEVDIGAVGCTVLYDSERDKIWFDGGKIDWYKYLSTHDNIGKKYKKSDEIIEVSFISGCCLMIKSEVIKKIGMLPIEYFMYFEDTDFCAQINDAGYKMLINRKAVIYHKVSASSGGEESSFTIEWSNRNRIIFMKKYKFKSKNTLSFCISCLYFFTGRIIRGVEYIISGKFDKFKSLIKGIKSGIMFKIGENNE